VFRGDKIDVVAALTLERKHHFSQLCGRDGAAVRFRSTWRLTDVPVLVKDTPEVAMGEKDGTGGAIPSPEAVLFTLVGSVTAYTGVAPTCPPTG
jgi:hypothetical protein